MVFNQIGSRKGIFIRSKIDYKNIYDIFSDIVMVPHVYLPNDIDGWFRFYDPSVLGAFLSFATEQQIYTIFGVSISEYIFEDELTSSMQSYIRPDLLSASKNERIKFTPDHIEVFDDAQHKYFRLQIMKQIWEKISAQKNIDSNIDPRPVLSTLLDIAEDSGVTQNEALQKFAHLATIYGLTFTEYQEVKDLLASPMYSEIKKVRKVEDILASLTAHHCKALS